MHVRHLFFAGFSVTLTAACGGGGGAQATGPTTPAVETLELLSVRDAINTDGRVRTTYYDEQGDVMAVLYQNQSTPGTATFEINALTVDLSAPPVPGFKAYISSNGPLRMVRGETSSGSGEAYAGLFPNDGVERVHARLAETVLPTSGFATLTGAYMGVISDFSTHEARGFITGDAQLFADFDVMTMQGQISNRINTSNRSFDLLVLPATPIDVADGSFGGETLGGLLSGLPGFDGAPGTYGGLVTGPDGGEAVGSVSIVHERAGVPTFRETGAFVAD